MTTDKVKGKGAQHKPVLFSTQAARITSDGVMILQDVNGSYWEKVIHIETGYTTIIAPHGLYIFSDDGVFSPMNTDEEHKEQRKLCRELAKVLKPFQAGGSND